MRAAAAVGILADQAVMRLAARAVAVRAEKTTSATPRERLTLAAVAVGLA